MAVSVPPRNQVGPRALAIAASKPIGASQGRERNSRGTPSCAGPAAASSTGSTHDGLIRCRPVVEASTNKTSSEPYIPSHSCNGRASASFRSGRRRQLAHERFRVVATTDTDPAARAPSVPIATIPFGQLADRTGQKIVTEKTRVCRQASRPSPRSRVPCRYPGLTRTPSQPLSPNRPGSRPRNSTMPTSEILWWTCGGHMATGPSSPGAAIFAFSTHWSTDPIFWAGRSGIISSRAPTGKIAAGTTKDCHSARWRPG